MDGVLLRVTYEATEETPSFFYLFLKTHPTTTPVPPIYSE